MTKLYTYIQITWVFYLEQGVYIYFPCLEQLKIITYRTDYKGKGYILNLMWHHSFEDKLYMPYFIESDRLQPQFQRQFKELDFFYKLPVEREFVFLKKNQEHRVILTTYRLHDFLWNMSVWKLIHHLFSSLFNQLLHENVSVQRNFW